MQGPIFTAQAGKGARVAGTSPNVPAGAGSPISSGVNARPVASNFRQALEVAGSSAAPGEDRNSTQFPADYRIQPGDTLTAIVRTHLQSAGVEPSARDILQGIGLLAVSNGIADPDRIYAGHSLDLRSLQSLKRADNETRSVMTSASPNAQQILAARVERVQSAVRASTGAADRPASAAQFLTSGNSARGTAEGRGPFGQLEKTLDRAVARGFIEPTERGPVRDRVVALAQKYRFSPDDFATVALMESDGFNPRASNGRCHGIIQFCEGSGRGAASVGLQNRAREILDRPVLEQIELVDRYFADVGLKESSSPVGLVDLYLSVLTPAARATRQADAALPVGGVQAKALHVSGERDRPITRNSILSGLQAHARAKLAEWAPQPNQTVRAQWVSSIPPAAPADAAPRVDRRPSLVDASVSTVRATRPST